MSTLHSMESLRQTVLATSVRRLPPERVEDWINTFLEIWPYRIAFFVRELCTVAKVRSPYTLFGVDLATIFIEVSPRAPPSRFLFDQDLAPFRAGRGVDEDTLLALEALALLSLPTQPRPRCLSSLQTAFLDRVAPNVSVQEHLALYGDVYAEMGLREGGPPWGWLDSWGVPVTELFGSPFTSQSPRYCSSFDLEKELWGSQGSFFSYLLSPGDVALAYLPALDPTFLQCALRRVQGQLAHLTDVTVVWVIPKRIAAQPWAKAAWEGCPTIDLDPNTHLVHNTHLDQYYLPDHDLTLIVQGITKALPKTAKQLADLWAWRVAAARIVGARASLVKKRTPPRPVDKGDQLRRSLLR